MKKHVHLEPPENFSPKIEVVACFCEVGDKILFLKNHPNKSYGGANKWCVPGGKVDLSEELVPALIREFFEETNILLNQEDLNFVKKVYVCYPDIEFLHNIFIIALPRIPENFRISEEHQDSAWVTKHQAMKMDLIPGEFECLELVYG